MKGISETNAEWLEGIRWVNAARPLTREEAHRVIEQAEQTLELIGMIKKERANSKEKTIEIYHSHKENKQLHEALKAVLTTEAYEEFKKVGVEAIRPKEWVIEQ